jgi:hypothetical protein
MTIAISGTTGITLDGQFNSASSMGFKNRIINGAMVISQRNGTSSSTLTSAQTYYVDRFIGVEDTDGSMTIQQSSTAPTGFINSLLMTTTSADASLGATQICYVGQKIEGLNIADLAWGTASAATITVSFWVRSSLTGTFGGAIANNAFNRSYPFTYTISSANTFEQKTITIAGDTTGTWPTDNGGSIQLFFGLGVGSTYSGTAGAWAAAGYISATGATSVIGTNGATFYITGVQLEKGSTATSFDYRPYGTELQLCQRYFERLPAGSMGMVAIRTNAWYGYIHWQTEKRANATAVLNGTLNFVGSAGDVNNQTPVGIDQLTTKSCRAYLQTGSYTAQGAFIYINTNLDISAEL